MTFFGCAGREIAALHRPYDDEIGGGNEDCSNRDVPSFDNDPRSDEQIKQAVYDRWARGEQDDNYGEEDR